ncbi:DCC1-like thiol-disulfide oxidoreductase family protein [Crocosphaera sp. UHCC 0190]|uniref:DCC1-like thiol-disulfide oxidoreductase family protein n=1 Tax=Crocosphaera sp. UHCC 0190 TaxID=3110246 RepID=UPI002B200566|nr:DCC1-like thiol-disulfide oxidoreductase family protein [Crocosphaera sp. UHCC 0190]MEA5509127.1 DCC1-like thiol-disulfide oxidoreductase family protein [Crocosphaera sp. UHCC 0190]
MNPETPSKLTKIFGLDLRSLAVFRMGLALVVMADLLSRAKGINAHYTDAGVLPREILTQQLLHPWYWSFHLISGDFFFQVFLFLIAFLIALALLAGYRTRLAIIATWALNVSLQNRNPALIFAGDDVLRAMLFWAMFLPLGCAYSLDSALNSSPKPLPKRFVSGATFAFIVQLIFIYTWSAAYKTKSELWWPDGDAVYYSLSFDQYATEFGHFLLGFPIPILRILTFGALIFEWVGPFIILIPFRTSFFRCLGIISFIFLHLGFELSFSIGVLSYLSVVNWLTLIPTELWDKGTQLISTTARKGLTIYYDADCGFCKKVVHFIRTFLILPGTPLLIAQDHESIYADMLEKNSWVVVDWENKRHYKFEAIAYVVSLSPILYLFAPLLRWQPLMNVGTKFYETIASNRKFAGNFTRPFKFRPLQVNSSLPFNIITLFLLFLTTMWNLQSFVDQTVARRPLKDDWINKTHHFLNRKTFQTINIIGYITRLDQSWSIFAPAPPRDDGWHVIVGKLKDGTEVNILDEKRPISWDKPTLKNRQTLYQTIQWRVYFINLNRTMGKKLYPHFADYLCREWNKKHSTDQQLESFEIYFMDERTVPPGETQRVEKKKVWQQSCSGE